MQEKSNIKYTKFRQGLFITIIIWGLATLGNHILIEGFNHPYGAAELYIVAVLFIALRTNGYIWGIVGAILSVVGTNYLFTFPYNQLNFSMAGYPVMFLTMLTVAVITSTMATRTKEEVQLTKERERRTMQLNQINQQLIGLQNGEEIANLLVELLHITLNRPVFFQSSLSQQVTGKGEESFLGQALQDRSIIKWAEGQRSAVNVEFIFSNCKNYSYIPVFSGQKVFGVVGIKMIDLPPLSKECEMFVQLALSQFALAFEKQQINEERQKIVVEKEKEKMRGNLLRAISHDLRTPLTGIIGASSVILDHGEKFSVTKHDKLIQGINDDAQFLLRLVENVLSVTRMNHGLPKLKKEVEVVEEVIGQTVLRSKKRFPGVRLSAHVPHELLMVPMDSTLIEQVLLNLIENAIRHSGSKKPIEVIARREGSNVIFQVKDYGDGIGEEELAHLFDDNWVREKDDQRGLGLGLSICKSIIHGHEGIISGENHEGGAIFSFTLPIGEEQ